MPKFKFSTKLLGTKALIKEVRSMGEWVPKPYFYGGAQDTKELENFLFNMEQYFHAMRLDFKEVKVTTTTIYLIGDAKLLWQTKYEDIMVGQCTIDS